MATLIASVGHEEEMTTALLSLAALQGHVTRATNNLPKTLSVVNPTTESITYSVDKLQNNWTNSLKDKWKSSNYVLMKSK